MLRLGCACLVLAAALAPLTGAAHGHGGGGSASGHPMHSHGGSAPAGPRHFGGGAVGSPQAPVHRVRPGPAHFVHGGFGAGWWVVGGAWIPWTTVDAVPPGGEAFYCQSLGAWYPAVQACPEDWLVVVPAPE